MDLLVNQRKREKAYDSATSKYFNEIIELKYSAFMDLPFERQTKIYEEFCRQEGYPDLGARAIAKNEMEVGRKFFEYVIDVVEETDEVIFPQGTSNYRTADLEYTLTNISLFEKIPTSFICNCIDEVRSAYLANEGKEEKYFLGKSRSEIVEEVMFDLHFSKTISFLTYHKLKFCWEYEHYKNNPNLKEIIEEAVMLHSTEIREELQNYFHGQILSSENMVKVYEYITFFAPVTANERMWHFFEDCNFSKENIANCLEKYKSADIEKNEALIDCIESYLDDEVKTPKRLPVVPKREDEAEEKVCFENDEFEDLVM